jgi:hypothetical protein
MRGGVQGANAVTLAARLNQKALLPDMMFPTVNRFNPNNGRPLPTVNGKFSGPLVLSASSSNTAAGIAGSGAKRSAL